MKETTPELWIVTLTITVIHGFGKTCHIMGDLLESRRPVPCRQVPLGSGTGRCWTTCSFPPGELGTGDRPSWTRYLSDRDMTCAAGELVVLPNGKEQEFGSSGGLWMNKCEQPCCLGTLLVLSPFLRSLHASGSRLTNIRNAGCMCSVHGQWIKHLTR